MNCLNCTTCESDCQLKEVDSPSLFCMNCTPKKAPCLKECPNNAIEILGGAITLNNDKCTKCGDCVEVCPINVIKI